MVTLAYSLPEQYFRMRWDELAIELNQSDDKDHDHDELCSRMVE